MEGIREKYRAAPATVVLAGCSVAIFALQMLALRGPDGLLFSDWALSGEALREGRWWTLVTHLFVHGNLLHLVVNVVALWFIGPEVERMLGRVRFLVLYFVSGVAGGLLQTAFSSPTSGLVGSSGAVCGVLLSFTTAYPELRLRALLFFILPVNMKAKTLGWGLIVVSLAMAVLGILPQIGHLAHLGGALAGAALTRWWMPPDKVPMWRPGRTPAEQEKKHEELLKRVVEEGLDALSREERKALEDISQRRQRRW